MGMSLAWSQVQHFRNRHREMMIILKMYALCLFMTWLAMVQSQIITINTCHFEQYINSTIQTNNTADVQWRDNLNIMRCNTTNPHKRQGVLKITPPSWSTKTIIRLHQEGEPCAASWHLTGSGALYVMAIGFGELYTTGTSLEAYGRTTAKSQGRRPPAVVVTNFVSTTMATKVELSMFYTRSRFRYHDYNIVDKVYPPSEQQKITFDNMNIFRMDYMRNNSVYLGLNRMVNSVGDPEGAGLYYVCVEFQ